MVQIAAIDLDNVLGTTDAKLRQLIREISGLSLIQADIRSWDYALALTAKGLADSEARRVVDQAFDRFHGGECIEIEPVEGAVENVLKLRKAGFDIKVVTGRPRTTICEDLTKRWLERVSLSASWLQMEANKAAVCAGWSCLVEDNADHAKGVAKCRIPVYLFDYPWNRHIAGDPLITRVTDWQHVSHAILERDVGTERVC